MSCKSHDVPRPEYPRPNMVRDKWLNLNGCWEFEIDHGRSGKARKLFEAEGLNGKIIVPLSRKQAIRSGIQGFYGCGVVQEGVYSPR